MKAKIKLISAIIAAVTIILSAYAYQAGALDALRKNPTFTPIIVWLDKQQKAKEARANSAIRRAENRIPGEKEDRYVVTKADWSYLCKNGKKLYDQSSITTPSGITIHYRFEDSDIITQEGRTMQSKIPMKPIYTVSEK